MINKYKLAGFLLMYHEVIKLGREVMVDHGLSDPSQKPSKRPQATYDKSSAAEPSLLTACASITKFLKCDISGSGFLLIVYGNPVTTMLSINVDIFET